MSWDAVGAIAELIGALGVIASLIYLAKQINANSDNIAQNTRALISDRDVSSNEAVMEILGSLAKQPELAALVMKGGLDAEPLSDLERFRYAAYLASSFESHQTFFVQHVKGSVSNELWNYYSGVMDRQVRMPGVAKWWLRNSDHFDPQFAEYIQRKLPDGAEDR